MKCAIHQPQFVPWLGYMQKIRLADVFVLLDNVQYHKNEFQNRNRILTQSGVQWLTLPVSFRFGSTLREVALADTGPWRRKLWRTLEHAYGRVPHFARHGAALKDILDRAWDNLAAINTASVVWLCECFEIGTRLLTASDLGELTAHPTQRLVEICRSVGADTYLSGSLARRYLEPELFAAAGIALEFQDFRHPVYAQHNGGGEFVSHMSAIDGLFNCGGGSPGREALNL